MKLVYGELWEYEKNHPDRWVVITTNGSVKNNGCNVMGSGCAKEWADRNPAAPKWLGDRLKQYGANICYAHSGDRVVTFPTKHLWHQDSDIDLIRNSAQDLAEMADRFPNAIFVLPRPGVGAGKLKWDDVLPVIEPILPDNVHVITWEE